MATRGRNWWTSSSEAARRTATIGLITDKIASAPFAGPLITGANESALRRGYALLTIDTQAHEDYIAGAVSVLHARDVEGLVYAAQSVGEVSVPESAYSRPLVLSNAFSSDATISETEGCVTPSCAAALAMLRHATTSKNTSRSRKRSRRPMRVAGIGIAYTHNGNWGLPPISNAA